MATLKNLVIPGSHNSATCSIPNGKPFSAIAITQNLTITQQLHAGVRFFDLRIASGKRGKGVYIFHGRIRGGQFEKVLNEIRSFCKTYPTEFVVLHVVAEYGQPFSNFWKRAALGMLRSRFGLLSASVTDRLLCKVTSRNELLTTPIQELIQQNGRVCVLLDPRIYNGFVVGGVPYNNEYVKKEYGFLDSTQWLWNKFHDTDDTMELLKGNLEVIQFHNARKRRYFVNNQFVLTPKFQSKNIGGLLLGKKTLQPVQLANQGLYQPPKGSKGTGIPALHQTFLENHDKDWNLVSMDFVDLVPSFVDLLIGVNFSPLRIELALVGDRDGNQRRTSANDVTELVRQKVLRGTCLMLFPRNMFDPSVVSVSSLALIYTISGIKYSIVIPMEASSTSTTTPVIVLNEHNHLRAGGTELIIGEGTEGNGTIVPPDSGHTVTWQKTERMSFRFGYLKEMD